MIVPAGAILLALYQLATCYADRGDPRVPDHLARIAYAESEEARDVDEAAALSAIALNESGNCLAVQDHYTHSGALSLWQLEGKRGKYPGPFLGLEYEPIHNAAHAAIDVWRHSHQCGQSIADRFTAYGGRPCGTNWPSLTRRVNSYWYIRSMIVKGMHGSK